MSIFCVGLSHQTANVSVRERFAVPDALLAQALQRLRTVPGVDEAVILSTCNRTELYLAGFAGRSTPETVFAGLQRQLVVADLEHLFQLPVVETVRHLFRVTSGLESMVVGEAEIFGQVKKAYHTAAQRGLTGKYLNRLFQKSFQVGGRAIRFDQWEQEFVDVDILVSSTSAPPFLLTAAKLEPIMRRPQGGDVRGEWEAFGG